MNNSLNNDHKSRDGTATLTVTLQTSPTVEFEGQERDAGASRQAEIFVTARKSFRKMPRDAVATIFRFIGGLADELPATPCLDTDVVEGDKVREEEEYDATEALSELLSAARAVALPDPADLAPVDDGDREAEKKSKRKKKKKKRKKHKKHKKRAKDSEEPDAETSSSPAPKKRKRTLEDSAWPSRKPPPDFECVFKCGRTGEAAVRVRNYPAPVPTDWYINPDGSKMTTKAQRNSKRMCNACYMSLRNARKK